MLLTVVPPWLVWLSELSTGPWTKGSLVQFPVRAHAWVTGQVSSSRHMRGNHTLKFLSLFFSLPSPLSKNKKKKIFFKKIPIFSPLVPSTHYHPSLQKSPLSSCPWVVHVSSWASPFPILFLTSPCLFCIYQLCFLIPEPFPPILSLLPPFPLPVDNPPSDLHIYGSIPVLFCFFCLLFRFSCW